MFTSKRRSFFTGDQNIQIEEKSPDDGEAGSDDVVKRNKTGVGLGVSDFAKKVSKPSLISSLSPPSAN